MSNDRSLIEPITTSHKLRFLTDEQLDDLQEATLEVLENVGVGFRSERALAIFAEHGARVDRETQIVKIPRDLVLKTLSSVPRYFTLGARDPALDLRLQDGVSYFTNDGCGHKVVDF
jgi:trimethylamine--corrinoid protein Co-methyltransferase